MIDVTIAAVRRPQILRRAVQSFKARILTNLEIKQVIANVDPVFGNESDQSECVSILQSAFPGISIFEPKKACFGAAVQRLWQATSAPYVFHMEDDWVALDDIPAGDLHRAFDEHANVGQVQLHMDLQNWDVVRRGHIRRRIEKWRIASIKLPIVRKSSPNFGTSPCLMPGAFARGCAARMNPMLDPEKQLYGGYNQALEDFVAPFQAYVYSPGKRHVIVDIGREWRDARNINKKVVNATSIWTEN